MLPDKQPKDLYTKNANQKNDRINSRYHDDLPKKQDIPNSQRPLKPQMLGKDNQVPSKIFKNNGATSNSHYNSSKNLRNVQSGVMGNNRYSSQNMKGAEYDEEEEEQIDEAEMGLDVADEKFSQPTFTEPSQQYSQTQRRGSQRYKDRVHTIRLQSQETYQREHMAGGQTYFTEMQPERKQDNQAENDEDDFDLFERAQEQIYSQRVQNNKYNFQYSQTEQTVQVTKKVQAQKDNSIDPSTFHHQYVNQNQQQRWTTSPPFQNDQNAEEEFEQDDQTPKEELYNFDPNNGAHFQYRELLKRLSDITTSSKGNSSAKSKYKKKRNQDLRMPLKEKTQEIVNSQASQIQKGQTQKKKNQSILEPKTKTFASNSAKNPKKTEKVQQQQQHHPLNHQLQPSQMLNGNQVTQQKLSKLLLTNQENFIEKKLKDIQNQDNGGDKKLQTSMSKNLSVVNPKTGNKTQDRALSQLEQQNQCQINNIKLKTSSQGHNNSSVNSQKHQTPIVNNHAKVPLSAKPNQISIANSNGASSINNIFQSTFVNSSVSSGKNANQNQLPGSLQGGNGTFVNGTKCPSSNFLRSATTALTASITTKSSAMLTQCNSNKQINTKETPEGRQKIRLTAGTTLSSTSKRNTGGTGGAGFTTLSNNSQGNTISSKGTQQHCYQNDFDKKSGQNSEQKNANKNNNSTNGQIGSGTHPSSAPRSNSSHKKVQVKNMMIKNQSFHKNLMNPNDAPNTTTIKKCNNDFYNAIFKQIQNTNFTALTGNMKMQPRLSETKKQSLINQTSKTTRVTGKNSRLSKGSNTGSVNSNSKQRSGERNQNQQSPLSDSQSKSQTRRSSKITTRGESQVNQDKTHSSQPQLNIMNPANANSQISLQKVNQMMKRMQESNQTTTNQWIKQTLSNQQQHAPTQAPQQQQSILMNHQVKKQPYGNNNMNMQRPLSGNNQNHIHPEQNLIFSRKDSSGQQHQQTLLQLLSERNENTVIEKSFDNRQSLINKHKTVEKKTSNEGKPNQQINQQHSEKMSKFLQQKKEELALATSKTSTSKKGFLLANIKIQKKANKHQQQTTQETLDRINLPTEEDDLRGNETDAFYQIQNMITDHGIEKYSIFEDQNYQHQQHQQHYPPPPSGNRNSVKVKAKNF